MKTVNTFLFSGVLPLMVSMVRMCLLILSHIHKLIICLILWSDIYCIILCDSAVLTHHFLFPIPPIFIGSGTSLEIIIFIGKWLFMYFLAIYPSALCLSLLTGLTKAQYLIALLQCTCTLHWSAAQCSHTCTWLRHGCAIPSVMFYQHVHSVYEIILVS